MSYTETFAQKQIINTASRIDNFTDVGTAQGFYINAQPVTGNNASQLSGIGGSGAVAPTVDTGAITAYSVNGNASGSIALPWTTTLPINQSPATYGQCMVDLPTIDIVSITGSPTTVYLGVLQAGARPFTQNKVFPVIVTNSGSQVLGQLTIESTSVGSVPGRVSFKLATGSAFAAGFTLNATTAEFLLV
jgi:hypothetical protein